MPLDAICLRGVVHELQEAVGTRIEKIQQPARELVILTLRGGRKLLLNAGANQARIHFTALSRGEEILIPKFEFARQMRNDSMGTPLKLEKNEIAIF